MIRPLLFALTVALTTSALADDIQVVKAPPEPKGMKSLFDGETLDGWDGDTRLWSVKDRVIHGETTAENKANIGIILFDEQQQKGVQCIQPLQT